MCFCAKMKFKPEIPCKPQMDRRAALALLGQASLLCAYLPPQGAKPSPRIAKIDDKVRQLLERLGHGLSVGDLKEVSTCFGFPALIFLDQTGVCVASASEIEQLFAQARESYRSRGIASTRPQIERVENLNQSLAAVDVRWPSFDGSGKQIASELSHYILQQDEPRIRVALSRTT
jgi:hypothetical protein